MLYMKRAYFENLKYKTCFLVIAHLFNASCRVYLFTSVVPSVRIFSMDGRENERIAVKWEGLSVSYLMAMQ